MVKAEKSIMECVRKGNTLYKEVVGHNWRRREAMKGLISRKIVKLKAEKFKDTWGREHTRNRIVKVRK